MGTISIIINEEYTDPIGEGKLGVLVNVDSNCFKEWSVTAKTSSSVWIEWTITGNGGTVYKTSGTTINGETLTSNTSYQMKIDKYKSLNNNQNTNLTQITVTLRDGSGGAILSSSTLSRYHTNQNC
tara:strand:- start:69614 stop:69991 length:378 start_codon:yes stop_codon:yes gene_type:complete